MFKLLAIICIIRMYVCNNILTRCCYPMSMLCKPLPMGDSKSLFYVPEIKKDGERNMSLLKVNSKDNQSGEAMTPDLFGDYFEQV